jgi:hypothetical protein
LPRREVKPTIDPKDMVPPELYSRDPHARALFAKFPASVQERLANWSREEHRELQVWAGGNSLGDSTNLEALSIQINNLWKRIAEFERGKEESLERTARLEVEQTYGSSVSQSLTVSVSDTLPPRADDAQKPSARLGGLVRRLFRRLFTRGAPKPQELAAAPLTEAQRSFYEVRREFYNLLSQGAGWEAMREFANAQPERTGFYQSFYKSCRLSNFLFVQHLENPSSLNTPELRSSGSIGREIVTVKTQKVQDEYGDDALEIESVTGVAAGKNGMALMHEAKKAGFEMATALEATQRAPLTEEERQALDRATNTNSAEIRQAIFGPAFYRVVMRNLKVLYPNKNIYSVIEQIFSGLSEEDFMVSIEALSDPDFKADLQKIQKLRVRLDNWIL